MCRRYRMSHSHFLGGPPLWTETDRDKAIWAERWEGRRCPQCGTHPDEWDPALGGHDHAYTAELHRCWGCSEKADGDKRAEKDGRPGVWVAMTPNPEV